MTTAAERLKQLSNLAGVSAAVMLLAIGTGATAGEALVDYSGLATGTAAEHLLTDREQQPAGGSGGQGKASARPGWAPIAQERLPADDLPPGVVTSATQVATQSPDAAISTAPPSSFVSNEPRQEPPDTGQGTTQQPTPPAIAAAPVSEPIEVVPPTIIAEHFDIDAFIAEAEARAAADLAAAQAQRRRNDAALVMLIALAEAL